MNFYFCDINLSYCLLDDEAFPTLKEMFTKISQSNKNLKHLNLSNNFFSSHLHFIHQYNTIHLEILKLTGCHLKSDCGRMLGSLLQRHQHIIYLDISNNYLRNKGIYLIFTTRHNVQMGFKKIRVKNFHRKSHMFYNFYS